MKDKFKNYDRIHFDIGANEGVFAIQIAKNEPKTFVMAFEPIPKLVYSINKSTTHLKNFMILRNAVSNFNGEARFNISPESQYGDYSCSSLLDFSDKSKTDWPGREDFKVIDYIDVDVIRLDSIITEYKIPKIDYLKIDTQGSDLKVLEGLGEFISIVRAGTMEAAAKESILYDGQNTQEESIRFLESNGFEITKIESNDVHGNEVNIDFINKNSKELKFDLWQLI
jgi:FkbM family methyltransferase